MKREAGKAETGRNDFFFLTSGNQKKIELPVPIISRLAVSLKTEFRPFTTLKGASFSSLLLAVVTKIS